jgi:hypothetical protein
VTSEAPASVRADVEDPIMPLDVALSTESPLSIAQSAQDGVPLAGLPAVAPGEGLSVAQPPSLADDGLTVALEAATDGTAQLFVVDAEGNVVASQSQEVATGATEVTITDVPAGNGLVLLVSFLTSEGHVQALSIPVES